jgi:hypothetical protein
VSVIVFFEKERRQYQSPKKGQLNCAISKIDVRDLGQGHSCDSRFHRETMFARVHYPEFVELEILLGGSQGGGELRGLCGLDLEAQALPFVHEEPIQLRTAVDGPEAGLGRSVCPVIGFRMALVSISRFAGGNTGWGLWAIIPSIP